jgi:hypothetical protein
MGRDTDGRVIQDSRVDRVCRAVLYITVYAYAYIRQWTDVEPTLRSPLPIYKIDTLKLRP